MFTKKRSKAIIAMLLAIVLIAVTAPAIFAQSDSLGTSGETDNLSGVPNSQIISTLQLGRSTGSGAISQTPRDIILVLDTSTSMNTSLAAGIAIPPGKEHYKPLDFLKDATTMFVEQTFVKAPKTRIGIVKFHSTSGIVSSFEDITGEGNLITRIASLSVSGATNYEAGLKEAFNMFYGVNGTAKGIKKAIVFMSDGEVNRGVTGQALTNLATEYRIIYNIDIYTLGFFHSVTQSTIPALADVLNKMSGENTGRYFQVEDPNNLDFVFGFLLEDLTNESPIILVPDAFGSKIYSDSIKTNAVWPHSTMDENQLRADFAMSKPLYVPDIIEISKLTAGAIEYGANDQYKTLLDAFITEFPDRPIYFFSYDFRKSSADNAQILEDAIIDIVEIQDLSPTVDIVGHGQGALIANHYAAKNLSALNQGLVNPTGLPVAHHRDTVDLTNAIVSIGAPFEGVPAIAQASMTGIPATLGNLDTTPSVLEAMPRDLIAQFPGIAEQFPTANYFTKYPFYTRGAFNGATFDKHIMTLSTYNTIVDTFFNGTIAADARAAQQLLASNRLMDIDRKTYFDYGDRQMTAHRPVFDTVAGVTSVVDVVFLPIGDSVVPRISSDYLGQLLANKVPQYVYPSLFSYHELLNESNNIEWLSYILRYNNEDPVIPINPSTGKPYVIIRIACPVDVAITNSNGDTLSNIGTRSIDGFGSLYLLGENSDIKIAVVSEEFASNLMIDMDATAEGTMDYSITYVDSPDTNIDNITLEERSIANIPLLDTTRITTKSSRTSTVLTTDYWGDGRYVDIVHGRAIPPMPEKSTLPPVVKPPIVTPIINTYDYTGTNRADVAITQAKISVKEFSATDAKALFEATRKTNPNATALILKAYNYDIASAAALQELAKLAKAANVEATIYFDTVVENKVTRRVKVVPAADSTAISLVNTGAVSTLQARLEKSHTNAVQVIGFSQITPIKGTAEVALTLNSKLGKDLVFYSYNATTNTYSAIDIEYRVDSNSYVHFKTDLNTMIIISDGPLTK